LRKRDAQALETAVALAGEIGGLLATGRRPIAGIAQSAFLDGDLAQVCAFHAPAR